MSDERTHYKITIAVRTTDGEFVQRELEGPELRPEGVFVDELRIQVQGRSEAVTELVWAVGVPVAVDERASAAVHAHLTGETETP